jgi:uncharacterized protein (TIGR02147 family)
MCTDYTIFLITMAAPLKSIFEYTNFREFLADFFEESKKTNPLFSHRYLASRLSLSTPNLIWLVIKGKRNLTDDVRDRLIRFLRLTKRKALYFGTMIDFLQAKTHEEKDRCFLRMMEMRRPFGANVIDERHYEYYSNWYNPVIRELVTSPDFKEDFRELGLRISPPISQSQARNSVELLLKLRMVRKSGGRYTQTNAVVTTGPEVKSLAVINYHRQMSSLAASSFDRCKSNERNITSVTLSISADKLNRLVKEANDFRARVVSLMEPCRKGAKVFQVNVQIFSLTREPSKRRLSRGKKRT